MIYLLGTILIVTGVAMALVAVASYVAVIRGNHAALIYGRAGVIGTMLVMALVWALLIMLFLARRFDIAYVNNYSSNDLDFFFTIASSWAGQPGSFAIWALWGVLAAPLLIGRSRHFEPYVLAVFMFVQASLMLFMLFVNPFAPLIDEATGALLSPTDGRGLNELLHNFWMIIHPPILFVGYSLAAVPFAFAIAGLLRRDYDNWVARALPWTLAAWAFLGLALLLGGYWAYETLGWGGYWGWDPVENSSLAPWLMLTALLHGMVLQRSHGGLRRSNFVLAISSYILVFYATFLTRSGVLSNFSVHSFVAEGILTVLLVYLVLLIGGSVALLVSRWRDIPTLPLSEKFFSRDSFFMLAILTFTMLSIVIGLGTSMPVISAIPGVGHSLQNLIGQVFALDDGTLYGGAAFTDGRFGLTAEFFERSAPPLGIVVVALLIIGPLLGWRDANMRHLLRALRWPAVAAVIAACIAMLIDVRDLLSLAYVSLGVFALGANLVMIIRTLRSGWLRIGGYLAHVGFCVMVIGVVGSSAYATPDERIVVGVDETVSIYGFDVTFNGYEFTETGRGVLDLTVQKEGDSSSFNAQPQLYYNERMGATMQTPAIKSYLWQDVYIAPVEYMPTRDPNNPALVMDESVVSGPYEITFLNYEIDREAMLGGGEAKVGAVLKVLYEGEEYTFTPVLLLADNPNGDGQVFSYEPVTLPGGHSLILERVWPTQRGVQLKIDGLDLPVRSAQAVVTVSTKPLVLLVWVGVGIGVLGGLIALLRRYLEGESRLSGARLRLPKSLIGLAGQLRWRGVAR
jgi:cytochrome c-type biogenesis protein CcmF